MGDIQEHIHTHKQHTHSHTHPHTEREKRERERLGFLMSMPNILRQVTRFFPLKHGPEGWSMTGVGATCEREGEGTVCVRNYMRGSQGGCLSV